jgi:hypothetical protein
MCYAVPPVFASKSHAHAGVGGRAGIGLTVLTAVLVSVDRLVISPNDPVCQAPTWICAAQRCGVSGYLDRWARVAW